MMGAQEYEFASVGLGCSSPVGTRVSCAGCSSPTADRLDGELRRRLLAYTLLHRCSDLPWYLEELPAPSAPTLDALAACWWRTDSH